MALRMSRQYFDILTDAQKTEVMRDGTTLFDPGDDERAARREAIQAALRAERKSRTIKRAAFDKLSDQDKWAHIQGGGLLED